MARKTSIVTVAAAGRDKGKQFLLTELPATRAEKWALRAFLALSKSGVEVPENIMAMGMAGIAMIGLKALPGLSFELAEPLLDEMMSCVVAIPDPKRPDITRPLIEDDTEEISTILMLRREVLALHVDFSTVGGPSSSVESPTASPGAN